MHTLFFSNSQRCTHTHMHTLIHATVTALILIAKWQRDSLGLCIFILTFRKINAYISRLHRAHNLNAYKCNLYFIDRKNGNVSCSFSHKMCTRFWFISFRLCVWICMYFIEIILIFFNYWSRIWTLLLFSIWLQS